MEFVSDLELYTTLLLFPILSFIVFLVIAFIEILDKHNEILFIDKNHAYTKHDFILPGIAGAFLLFLCVGMVFFADPYFDSLPPMPVKGWVYDKPEPQTIFSLIDKYLKPLIYG